MSAGAELDRDLAAGDDFFTPIANTKPFFKAAFEGFAGSGKTLTMAFVAIGLHQRIGSKKPIVLFDTEKSAAFLKKVFRDHGIEVLVRDSRSAADLVMTMERCRGGFADILLIDSLTHVWGNFVESYKAKKKRDQLQISDWGVLKPTWAREFSDPFVRDPYHCMFTGRAGFEFDSEVNSEGKREFFKVGVKMKVEGETAYEPDMLVLMERFEKTLPGETKEVWREATIIKDRTRQIDGKTFRDPTFKDFEPMIDYVLEEPSTLRSPVEGSSAGLFKTEDDKRDYLRQRDILLEKIEGEIVRVYPGQSAAEKKVKVGVLESAFGTVSWTEISGRSVSFLEAGLVRLKKILGVAEAAIVGNDPPAPAVAQAPVGAPNPPPVVDAPAPAPATPVAPHVDDPGPCGAETANDGGPCALPAGHKDDHVPALLMAAPVPAAEKSKRTRAPRPVPAAEQLAPLPKALCATCGGRDGNHKEGCAAAAVDARTAAAGGGT